MYRCCEVVGVHRGCIDDLCPSQDILGEDEGHRCCGKCPPKGKDRYEPEHYFEDVLEAARLIEGLCSKDIMFE